MDIKITAKNIKLTPAIKEFINTRVSKIENFFDNIVSAQVLISVEKKINQRADFLVTLRALALFLIFLACASAFTAAASMAL